MRALASADGPWSRLRAGETASALVVVVARVLGTEAVVGVWLGLLLWRIAGEARWWDLLGEMLRLGGWRRLSALGSLIDWRQDRMRSEEGCGEVEMKESR